MELLVPFMEAAVRTATPLLLAAAGEMLVQRSGMINIGLEGIVLAGAFGGAVVAQQLGGPAGFGGAMLAGIAVALVFAAFTLGVRANQIITGTAVTLLALGLTGTLYRTAFGDLGAGLTIPTVGPWALPLLSEIPLLGPALFKQPPVTYLAILAIPVLWWWLFRTHAGLALRAVGESPAAAEAAGVPVRRVRLLALVWSGAMGGLAGGTLVLSQVGTFAEGMSAGRGFIAIAIVVLGRWHPVGVAAAALLFGAATALQFLLQAVGFALPYQLFLALPYVLTLGGLAGLAGRVHAPAAMGRS